MKRGIYFTLELITGNYNSDFLSIFSNSTSKIRVAPPVKKKRERKILLRCTDQGPQMTLDLMTSSPFDSQAFLGLLVLANPTTLALFSHYRLQKNYTGL